MRLQLLVALCVAPVVNCAMADDAALKPSLDCYAALNTRPELAPLVGKVPLSGTQKATLEMQASKARPNAAERKAISAWSTMRAECFALGLKWLEQGPRWVPPIMLPANDERDALTSALYRGELNYGQFNVKNEALAADLRKRLADGLELARKEEASRRDEIARRQENTRREESVTRTVIAPPAAPAKPAKTLEQDLYECEQEAARSYPPAMVQRMTNPGYQAPPRPAQTTCSQIGTQFSCRTQPTGVVHHRGLEPTQPI